MKLFVLFAVSILIKRTLPNDQPMPNFLRLKHGASIYPCGRNTTHIMCKPLSGPLDNCTNFKLLEMVGFKKNMILCGINGMRSKEAQRNGYEIANMNQLYWDPDLAEMAIQYVFHCDISGVPDLTNYIGHKNFTIGQNYLFIDKFPAYRTWVTVGIHAWFEYSTINKPSQYSPGAKFTPYTQLIWPKSEYVGCAGARVAGGLLFVCYFGPRADQNNIASGFRQGRYCSKCPETRSTCSEKYAALCGHDDASIRNQPSLFMFGFISLIGLIDVF